jgi:hypothetical protein
MSYFIDDINLLAPIGGAPGFYAVNKFGETIDADAGIKTDVWDGADGSTSTDIWVPPTQARRHAIVSTSANDTAAGTGVRTIEVFGLTSWDSREVSETITTSGDTPVNTANEYVIIQRMIGRTWGSGGKNAGTIKATAETDGTITACIRIGANQTQMLILGFGSAQTFFMNYLEGSVIKNAGVVEHLEGELLYMPNPDTNAADNNAWVLKYPYHAISTNPYQRRWSPPLPFDGPGIIKVQVTTNQNNTSSFCAVDGILKDD